MIKIVIISHAEIAKGLIDCVHHILNKDVPNLMMLPVFKTDLIDTVVKNAQKVINNLREQNDKVLILSDIFGATPSNIASKLIEKDQVNLLTGVNLPMLLRAVSYSNCELETCTSKALEGAINGIFEIKR